MNTILIVSLIIAIIVIIGMIIAWPKVITISDDRPSVASSRNFWLKLQNEGKKYIKEKDNKIYLKIVK